MAMISRQKKREVVGECEGDREIRSLDHWDCETLHDSMSMPTMQKRGYYAYSFSVALVRVHEGD